LYGILAIIFISLLFLYYYDYIYLVSIVQRGIFKPALVSYYWYDFFHNNFSYTIFGEFENESKSFIIGQIMKNNLLTRSNTGYLGHGYSFVGYYGIFIYSLIVGLLFNLVENFQYKTNHNKKLLLCLFIVPLIEILISSNLMSYIFSKSFLLYLFLLPKIYSHESKN
jgi:fructose-specific phosphotransferase system IIC component